MMLMVMLCFLVHVHADNPSPLPERVGIVSLPQGAVNEHDRLDDVSRLVLGYTIKELKSFAAYDRVFTGYNIMQEQYMRTADWVALNANSEWQVHVKAYYEMVLQWLEDIAHHKKSRFNVIKEMTRQWKKLHDDVQGFMKWRFIGFQLISDMADVKWQ